MSEDEVKSITAIARSSVGSQAFHANAMAFPSQAESTLTRYLGGHSGYKSEGSSSAGGYHSDDTSKSLGNGDSCFGCKGIHPWMRDGVILCPNKDKPGIRAKAEQAYQKWRAAMKAKCSLRDRGNKKRKVDYNRMSPANKERVKEAMLASMGIKPAPAPDKPSSDSDSTPKKKPLIFIINVPVLSVPSPSRNILPAPIVSKFPHIRLQLGSTLDCPDCPSCAAWWTWLQR